ncbi:MAG TPA: PQQ-binding-like beta-propeller repeat protein [Vicinamibacteria bacterium]|nr:PQQ-binding-like beta-propeller repeat protein [Vicinamibacteria bacterium]
MSRRIVILALLVPQAVHAQWSTYGADNRNSKYVAASAIDKDNVEQLDIVWRWSSPDNVIASERPDLFVGLFKGTPILRGDALYVATGLHRVASVDARTGETRWTYDPGIYERGTPQRLGFIHRGVAAWHDRILHVTGEGYLTALSMETGEPIDTFGHEGSVDLLHGIRRPVERFEFGANSPAILVGDVIVVGSFVQDGWLAKEGPPGDVRGYRAESGELVWTFRTIPEAGEEGVETWLEDSWRYSGSTNVWTYMAADDELGYVYLPTSTPTNDHYGGHRPGDNLFAESIVCLDAETGERVWHFQTTHHGVWDYDLPAGPVLADVTVDGKRRKILAQVSKQAFVYVLDRETGEPIWPIDERPVPQSNVERERTATTQPWPTKPAAFDLQGLTVDDLIDFTPELRHEATAILSPYDWGVLYTPPSERGTVLVPGVVGGASWAGAALDPVTGWLYVPSVTTPVVVKLVAPDPERSDMRFLAERQFLSGPDGLPLVKPPYGRITAINLNTGEHEWMTPLGSGPRDHPRLEGLNLPRLGWPSRGFVLVTDKLLFAAQEPELTGNYSSTTNSFDFGGRTREPVLSVLDKTTGTLLTEIPLPANAGGSLMTYVLDSKPFVVVPVGGGGVPSELVALSLQAKEGN